MMDADYEAEETCEEPAGAMPPAARIVATDELFGGEREIWIEHQGVRYRLRITRRNKLILQK